MRVLLINLVMLIYEITTVAICLKNKKKTTIGKVFDLPYLSESYYNGINGG